MSYRGRRAASILFGSGKLDSNDDTTKPIVVPKKPIIDYHRVVVKRNNENILPIEDMTSCDYSNDKYSNHTFCQDLLKDKAYMWCYRHAICYNKHLFKDKIVLELQCGTGILSMLCAKAGAKHVYAVHDSNITQLTQRIVNDNKLSDVITVVQGKIADIELPVKHVDVIISTVFGESVFCETELMALLEARDKWLKPDGILLPDKCTLYIAAIQEKLGRKARQFWENVYDFKMTPMLQAVNLKPVRMDIKANQLISTTSPIKVLNFYEIQRDDCLEFKSKFCLQILRTESIHALMIYFKVEFTKCHIPVLLSTSPNSPQTRWGQTVFFLNLAERFYVERGEEATGDFHMFVHLNRYERVNFIINLKFIGKHCTIDEQQIFNMK